MKNNIAYNACQNIESGYFFRRKVGHIRLSVDTLMKMAKFSLVDLKIWNVLVCNTWKPFGSLNNLVFNWRELCTFLSYLVIIQHHTHITLKSDLHWSVTDASGTGIPVVVKDFFMAVHAGVPRMRLPVCRPTFTASLVLRFSCWHNVVPQLQIRLV